MANWVHNIRGRLEGDKVIWMIALILSVWSLLSVYSAISSLAYKANGDSLRFLMTLGRLLMLGLVIMYVVHTAHYKYFALIAIVLLVFAVLALSCTLTFGSHFNEARRWWKVRFLGRSLQTSNSAKARLRTWMDK